MNGVYLTIMMHDDDDYTVLQTMKRAAICVGRETALRFYNGREILHEFI